VDTIPANSERKPLVSVIVPVYNGGSVFKECLEHLLASDYPSFEVIVSDDGSTDGSLELAQQTGVVTLRSPVRQGAAVARNAGANIARGELLFFTDSDVWVEKDTISKLAAYLWEDPTLDAVIGSYSPYVPYRDVWSRFKNLHHHYIHQISQSQAITFWTGCGMIRRESFFAVGGFDHSYKGATIEDIELGYRLTKAGRKIRLAREIQVTHAKRYTLLGLMRSDIFHRAVPWTVLMLKEHTARSDLNTTWSNALSVFLSWLLIIALLGIIYFPLPALIASGAILLLFILLSLHFYRYANKCLGFWFVLKMIPVTWLYFLYSGYGLILGILKYIFRDRRGESKAVTDK
jgi:glycosyltransferase involved in cell wall biosynthesis